jgi:hypothetical protein
MPPAWLTALSWAGLAVAFASTAAIACDIWGRGYRQRMRIMEAVWPVSGLYLGPAALAAYRAWGRPQSPRWQEDHGGPPGKPGYAVTATGRVHRRLRRRDRPGDRVPDHRAYQRRHLGLQATRLQVKDRMVW